MSDMDKKERPISCFSNRVHIFDSVASALENSPGGLGFGTGQDFWIDKTHESSLFPSLRPYKKHPLLKTALSKTTYKKDSIKTTQDINLNLQIILILFYIY